MATMITSDCINCGACEPECPNNAISQGDPVYVIDPNLCTECVGFHDYEACAAVCPVDCCVTDPNNIESEEVLIARARALHPEIQFGEQFESRFRKGQGKGAGGADGAAAPAPPRAAAPGVAAGQSAAPAQSAPVPSAPRAPATAAAPAPSPGPVSESKLPAEEPVDFIDLPDMDSWEIPVRCFKCNQTHVEPVRSFLVGNVLFCPHCHKSMVVRDNLNFHIRSVLKEAYERWQRDRTEFEGRREKELADFIEKRARDARAFEAHQQHQLEKIRAQLGAIGETYDAPGRPLKRGARFGWG